MATPAYNQGTVFPYEDPLAIAEDLSAIALAWRWVNMTPIFTRVQAYPAGQQEFHMIGSIRRPDTVTVPGAQLVTDTTLTLSDVSYLMNGDVLAWDSGPGGAVEHMEIIADPNESTSQITVVRGDGFTTPVAIPAGTVMRIVGNSRTGGEENQKGVSPVTWKRINWIQTFDHPVEVAGITQDTALYRSDVIEPGATTPLDANRMRSLGDMIIDVERTLMYGQGMSPTDSSTKRAKTKGFKQLCNDAGSYTYQPPNYASYSPEDFVRDISEATAANGGSPNLFFVSTDWQSGMAKWKMNLVRIDMGTTDYNITIDAFESVGMSGIFVLCPKMKKGTIFATNDADIFIRYMRMPTWYLRGKQGDTWKGDMLSRIGAHLNFPEQSRWVEGITGWAPAA